MIQTYLSRELDRNDHHFSIGGQVAVNVTNSDESQVGVKVINNFICEGIQLAVKVNCFHLAGNIYL